MSGYTTGGTKTSQDFLMPFCCKLTGGYRSGMPVQALLFLSAQPHEERVRACRSGGHGMRYLADVGVPP